MTVPSPDYSQRGFLLPAGCKDLFEALRYQEAVTLCQRRAQEPAIRRQVSLPGIVSVRYLAEVSGRSLGAVARLMNELQILVDVNRSVEFEDAARILRRFGIGARRQLNE